MSVLHFEAPRLFNALLPHMTERRVLEISGAGAKCRRLFQALISHYLSAQVENIQQHSLGSWVDSQTLQAVHQEVYITD